MTAFSMFSLLPPSLRWRVYSRLAKTPYAPGPSRSVRRKINGSYMLLDQADWMERFATKAGCYYDLSTTAVLKRILKPGWWMMDVGANVGFTTLLAARLIGPSGRVLAFEPNQAAAARLRTNVALNALSNVDINEIGLGSRTGIAQLATGDHHGTSSMRTGSGRRVCVRTGDEFAPPPDRPTLIKIDVEGYELEVLRGMRGVLARPNVVLLIEVTDKWLREAGGSAEELFAELNGFNGRTPVYRPMMGLALRPIDRNTSQYDVLFTPRL